jgi:hypothetical protein
MLIISLLFQFISTRAIEAHSEDILHEQCSDSMDEHNEFEGINLMALL